MRRVIAVVEGITEQRFVDKVLATGLAAHGVFLSARLVGKPGYKGGGREYDRPRKDILMLLKQEASSVVTTMFDFYGMRPKSWPARVEAAGAPHKRKAFLVENAIGNDIAEGMKRRFDRRRFMPYVQMYEYEALLFSRPQVIAEVVGDADVADRLLAIRRKFNSPEEINDSARAAPSKRIKRLCPAYQKTLHGVIAAQRIGVEIIRQECSHFNDWFARLEKLGEGTSS